MEILKNYEISKLNLLKHIDSSSRIAETLGALTISEKLRKNQDQLKEDQFLLTVVGEFSRGKSMFINSLLGEEILPSKVKPTTAMITSITYDEKAQFELTHRSSDKRTILTQEEFFNLSAPKEYEKDDPEDIARYESEISFFQDIKQAEITYPSVISRLGVQLVDTPGTNDIDVAREEVTLAYVPKSDAVIVLLSAKQPVTSDEVTFIKERILSEYISKVFIVLNRIDNVHPEDRQKSIDYAKEKISEFIPNANIYPVSSKDALTIKMSEKGLQLKNSTQKFFTLKDAGLWQFEQDLNYFLEHEKGQVKLTKHVKKLHQSLDELLDKTIALRLAGLDSEIEDINQKIAEIRPQLESYRKNANGIVYTLEKGLNSSEYSFLSSIKSELQNYFERVVASLNVYNNDIMNEDQVKNFIKKRMKEYEPSVKEKLQHLKKETLDLHLKNAYSKLNQEETNLNDIINTTFDLRLNDRSDYQLNEDSDILGLVALGLGVGFVGVIVAPALMFLGALGAIFGGLAFYEDIVNFLSNSSREKKIKNIQTALKDSFRNELEEQMENNKYEWRQIIHKVKDRFIEDVEKKIETIQQTFDLILKENVKDKTEREKTKFELLVKQQEILSIKETTKKLLKEVKKS